MAAESTSVGPAPASSITTAGGSSSAASASPDPAAGAAPADGLPDPTRWIDQIPGGMAITGAIAVHEGDPGFGRGPQLWGAVSINPKLALTSGHFLFVPASLTPECGGCPERPAVFLLDSFTGQPVDRFVLAESGRIVDLVRTYNGTVWGLLQGTDGSTQLFGLTDWGGVAMSARTVETRNRSMVVTNYLATAYNDVFVVDVYRAPHDDYVTLLRHDGRGTTTPVIELCDQRVYCGQDCTSTWSFDKVQILCQINRVRWMTVDPATRALTTKIVEPPAGPAKVAITTIDGDHVVAGATGFQLWSREFQPGRTVAAPHRGQITGWDTAMHAVAFATDSGELGNWDGRSDATMAVTVSRNSAGLPAPAGAVPVLGTTGVWWVSPTGILLVEPRASAGRRTIATIDAS
ncbi:hypothetical protein GIS00_14525 [Nakamurella sp. YIM 132087]|uniref:Uncharacterized protein n=1 Tax=Nakamurella alba TaxID=2665158 RepID=A0A7K1FM26_9ACTN|nr:hypothetical protein [Nakamurella alba]MTD15156.1 hypothetical protein [Nakamurella alba]